MFSALMSMMRTRAPSLRKRAAVASPIPLAPPVTMTPFPSNRRMPVRRTSSVIVHSSELACPDSFGAGVYPHRGPPWSLHAAACGNRPDLYHLIIAHGDQPVVHSQRSARMVGDDLQPRAD